MTDTRHTVSESADKITLKPQVTRGEGTRDQDRIDVKVKGDDPEDTSTADSVRKVWAPTEKRAEQKLLAGGQA